MTGKSYSEAFLISLHNILKKLNTRLEIYDLCMDATWFISHYSSDFKNDNSEVHYFIDCTLFDLLDEVYDHMPEDEMFDVKERTLKAIDEALEKYYK